MASREFSGKSGSLEFLKSLGLQVPDWKMITHDQVINWGDSQLWEEAQIAINTNDPETKKVIDKFLATVKIPPELLETFKDNWLAVRSSASAEDSVENSFAGIFETKLFVKENLEVAIKEVWSSLYSPKAIAYCKERGVPLKDLEMNVIIQHIIIGEKSGVLFQADPMGKIDKLIITAGYGLGQGVVDETSDTDQFTFRGGKLFESTINAKTKCQTYNEQKRILETSSVRDDLIVKPVLDNDELHDLIAISRHLDANSRLFLDIEFTIRDGMIFLLQARPITTLHAKKDILIYDNSNIAENYPGQSLPLTYSALQRAYAANFRNLVSYLGFPEDERKDIDNRLNQMVGYFGGQIYYNLNNWYSVYSLLPVGQEKAMASFDEMVGIDARTFIKSKDRSSFEKTCILAKIFPKFFSYFILTKVHHRKYKAQFSDLYPEFKLMIKEARGIFEILNLIEEIDRRYLAIIKIPLFNDFFSSILNKSCRHFAIALTGERGNSILNDLLSHRENLESSKAIYSLLELASLVRANLELRIHLENHIESEDVIQSLAHHPNFEEFDLKLRYHLDRYGDRSQWEMKLETPTARENPKPLIRLILDYSIHQHSTEEHKEKERQKAEKADKELIELTTHKKFKLMLFRLLFKKNAEAVCFREDARFDRVRMKGLLRELMLRLGAELVLKNRLKVQEDIFYFSYEELFTLNYESYGKDYFIELIDLRKKHLKRQEDAILPDRIVVNDLTPLSMHEIKRTVHEGQMRGLPCSGGIAEAEIVIVKDLNQAPSLSGKILVAERTDPSWGYFFVGVKGIIVEKGSMLSHAAIISRELGIPCIINVTGATYTLKDGATVRMDGETGEITIV